MSERFVTKARINIGDGDFRQFTGQLNASGIRHGIGKTFFVDGPQKGRIVMAMYEDGKASGYCYSCFTNDEVVVNYYNDLELQHGPAVKWLPDGTREFLTYDNGKLVSRTSDEQAENAFIEAWKDGMRSSGFVLLDLLPEINYKLFGVDEPSLDEQQEQREMELRVRREAKEQSQRKLLVVNKRMNFANGAVALYTGITNGFGNRDGPGVLSYIIGGSKGNVLTCAAKNGQLTGYFMDSLSSGAVRYGHYNDFWNTDGPAMLVTSLGERYIEFWANGTRKTVEKQDTTEFFADWKANILNVNGFRIVNDALKLDYDALGMTRPNEEEESEIRELLVQARAEVAIADRRIVEIVADREIERGDTKCLFTGSLNAKGNRQGPGKTVDSSDTNQRGTTAFVCYDNDVPQGYFLAIYADGARMIGICDSRGFENGPGVHIDLAGNKEYLVINEGKMTVPSDVDTTLGIAAFLEEWQVGIVAAGFKLMGDTLVEYEPPLLKMQFVD